MTNEQKLINAIFHKPKTNFIVREIFSGATTLDSIVTNIVYADYLQKTN